MTDQATTETPKPANPKHIRATLYRLTLDYLTLTTQFPTPPRSSQSRRTTTREYGHPAEWASHHATLIADELTSWHDYLAEHRNETRPRRKRIGYKTDGRHIWQYAVNEKDRTVAAVKYLEPRLEQLCDLAPAEALKELPDLHHTIRRTLGYTRPRYTLPIPCPNDECGLKTLTREQGIGQDFIICGHCGYAIKAAHYPLLIRMALEAIVTDTPNEPTR